jgi:hypothetical protein
MSLADELLNDLATDSEADLEEEDDDEEEGADEGEMGEAGGSGGLQAMAAAAAGAPVTAVAKLLASARVRLLSLVYDYEYCAAGRACMHVVRGAGGVAAVADTPVRAGRS